MAEIKEELKSLLIKLKEESEKVDFKTQLSKNKDHGIQSHHFMAKRRETETVTDFLSLGSKINGDSDSSHEIKRCLLLGRKVTRNIHSTLKSRDITLLTVHVVKAVVFPVVMYRSESWTIKKAEC